MKIHEYVNREALINRVCEQYSGGMNTFMAKPNDFVNMIEDAPSVQATEERHAHWKKIRFFSSVFGLFQCSACGYDNERTHYCPDCGAKMDEAETHD